MTTHSMSPEFPVPNRQCRVVFTLTNPTANNVRVYCTQAPEGSALYLEIQASTASAKRTGVYNGKGGPDAPWTVTLDKGGEYTFTCQEVQIGTPFTGGYQDDPRGAPLETLVGAESTITLYVGQKTQIDMGTSRETGTLSFYVFGDVIRHTTIQEHGEATPTIGNASTDRARMAGVKGTATVGQILTNGMLVSDAYGDIPPYLAALIDVMNAHMTLSPNYSSGPNVHVDPDFDNIVPVELGEATLEGLVDVASRLLRAERQHFLNDEGTGAGSANGDPGDNPPATQHANPYHVVGRPVGDQMNLPITGGLADSADAFMALADVHFSLEEHMQNLAVHGVADTQTLPTLPPILQVSRNFLDYLSTIDPTPAPGDTIGATIARSYGARVL